MKRATKAIWVFLGTIALTVGVLLMFIQSKYFADALKQIARKYMPSDFGVEGDFSELAVKLVPPGVVIKNPSVVLRARNPVNLPAGTKLDAQFIDVTFQFFQLLTGSVTINAFAIHGATLKLDLDEKFFSSQEKAVQPKLSIVPKFSWDSLVRFNFRSVSLVDSQVDLRMKSSPSAAAMQTQAFAKELTIGRSTVDGVPSYDLAVDLQRVSLDLPFFRHSLSQFQASVEISSKGATIRNLGMQEGELNFHTNGSIKGNLLNPKSLKSELSYILRGPVQNWLDPSLAGKFIVLPKDKKLTGELTVEGKFSGDLMEAPKGAETTATIQLDKASFGEWRADKALVKGAWKSPQVLIDSAEIEIDGGKVQVDKFALDMAKSEKAFDVALHLEKADLRKLLGPAVNSIYPIHMLLSGDVRADVVLGHDFQASGDVDLRVSDFSLDNQKPNIKKPLAVLLALKSVDLKSHFAIDGDGVRFDQTEVGLPHSKLKAFGKVNGKEGFNIDVQGNFNLTDVGRLSAFEIGGVGNLHWTITGKKPDVLFTFDLDMTEGRYLNLNLGDVKGRVAYNDGPEILYFTNLAAKQGRTEFLANGTINLDETDAADMTVQVSKGTIQDFAKVFSEFLKKSVPWYPYDLVGQLAGVIRVSGKTPLDQLSVEGDMELENVEYLREIFRRIKVHAGYRRGAYIAENAVIQKKGGFLRGGMSFGADDVLKFDLRSDGFSTLDIDRLASLGIPYRAPLQIETAGAGKIGSLKSRFSLNMGDGVIKSYSVPSSEFVIKTENGRVQGDASVFHGELQGKLDLGWDRGSSSTFDIEARHFDFQPILVALNSTLADDAELDSEVTGRAHLKFQTGALSRLSGNVALNSYSLRRRGYSLTLDRPVAMDIQNGNYEFEGLKFTGDGTSLSAKGKVRDGHISYSIGGMLNLGFFEFLVQEIASIHGSAKVDAHILGQADSPDLKAAISAAGADLRLRAIEQPFEDLRFKVDWKNAALDVTDVGAKFAGGSVRGSGDILLYSTKLPDLDFRLELDNPKVKVYPVAYARTNGRLTLKGGELPYKVKGSLVVPEALIRENFNLSEGSRILRSSKFLPNQKKGAGSTDLQIFDLDVDLLADRNIFVKNDLFDLELKGNLKVINSVQTPRLLGQASVLHGKLLFKDNFFAIQSGNIRFTNPAALDPEFDLTAQTEVKGYKIVLVTSGSVSDYKLNFQSQPPLSENDIVSLLTLGVTTSGFQSISRESRDAYSRDELYGLLFSQSGVNKGLQQKFGLKVRVDQSTNLIPENAFRARGAGDDVAAVAPKVVIQKEVTKNLKASVGTTVGLGEQQERNAGLEYDLPFSKNLSVLGTYQDQRGPQPSQTRTSVGADLKYQIRFK